MTPQEEEHLKLIAIFHYVVSGLTALFPCLPLIHLTIGLVMVFGGFPGNQAPPAFVGWLFIILGGGFFFGRTESRYLHHHRRKISRPAQALPFRFCCGLLRMPFYAIRNGAGRVYDRFALARVGESHVWHRCRACPRLGTGALCVLCGEIGNGQVARLPHRSEPDRR